MMAGPLSVIGAGYVGVVQAAGLASLGYQVRVGERVPERVTALAEGQLPFYEPGLAELLAEGVEAGRLSFHTSNQEATQGTDLVFITLPTPSDPAGAVDTSIVEAAVLEMTPSLPVDAVIVLKSTAGLGTTERLACKVKQARSDLTMVSNPEFLREGSAVTDFFHPDRIVIGSSEPHAVERVAVVYRGLTERGWSGELVKTTSATAELIKYAANAYLASRITFANSIANLCERVGADVDQVLAGLGSDPRIGPHFLQPGPGFGGSCFPKDIRALAAAARQLGYPLQQLEATIAVNEDQPARIVAQVAQAVGGQLVGVRVGLWGLAFKAGTDDLRESPAVQLAELLTEQGAVVQAYDPQARGETLPQVDTAQEAATGADVLVIATEWPEFAQKDWSQVREVMAGRAVVDARNLLEPSLVTQAGLEYMGRGRQ